MSREMDEVLDWKVQYALSEEMGDRGAIFGVAGPLVFQWKVGTRSYV